MILFRKYRERLILLEYENKRMAQRIKEIEKQLKPIIPMAPEGRRIVEPFNWDISYYRSSRMIKPVTEWGEWKCIEVLIIEYAKHNFRARIIKMK